MNVLQIGAYIPGKGEVNLLASPTIESAAIAMTGRGKDADGQTSLAMGGAFEVAMGGPGWGEASQEDGRVSTEWRGHPMTLPGGTDGMARGGLMLANGGGLRGADGVTGWGTGPGCLPCEGFWCALAIEDGRDHDCAAGQPVDRNHSDGAQHGRCGRAGGHWLAPSVYHFRWKPGTVAVASSRGRNGRRYATERAGCPREFYCRLRELHTTLRCAAEWRWGTWSWRTTS